MCRKVMNFREVVNRIIPAPGYKAITLFPFVFVRKNVVDGGRWRDTDKNHEAIHIEQQKELLVIPFYVIYLLEYAFKIVRYGFDIDLAYHCISFEREAYNNQNDLNYLSTRKHFAQWRSK